MRLERAEVAAFLQRYLACCNEHIFDQLGEFVSEQVTGSGTADGLAGCIDRLNRCSRPSLTTAGTCKHWSSSRTRSRHG